MNLELGGEELQAPMGIGLTVKKLNHIILKKLQTFKENSHNFKTIGTLNTYSKQ